MRTTRKALLASIALFFAVGPYAAQAEDGFFSKMLQQATDLVSPSTEGDTTPRTAQGQAITVKDDGVAVDTSHVATQATIGDDDTVILKSDGGAAPVAEPQKEAAAEPEKKAEAPADNTPSMFDDVLNSLGLGDETAAPAAVDKK